MVSPDSGGGNSGFRCASGEALNEDKTEIAIEGLDPDGEGMSQEKLQKVGNAERAGGQWGKGRLLVAWQAVMTLHALVLSLQRDDLSGGGGGWRGSADQVPCLDGPELRKGDWNIQGPRSRPVWLRQTFRCFPTPPALRF